MDGFSTKILRHIVERCDFGSIKDLRLVSHKWHSISTPMVFEHVYMGLFDHSLSKFENLASSQLAKHIKRLTFYCDVLPLYERYEWELEIDSTFGNGDCPNRSVDAAWQAYQDLVQEQRAWQHLQQGKRFQACLLKVDNLIEASAIRTMAGDVNANRWPLWRRLTRHCIVGPDQWKRRREESPNPFMDDDADARASLALLEGMGQRASQGRRPVITLRLQLFCQTSYFLSPLGLVGSAQPVPSPYIDTIKPRIHVAFENLTDLSLYLETPSGDFAGILADFSRFLSLAKQLRSLRLWFDYFEDSCEELSEEASAYADHMDFFSSGAMIWPKIEHLALKMNVPSVKLLAFLKLHSDTLRSLELRHMLVGDVPLLLRGIPEVLRLEHVFIQGLWHDGPGLPPQEHLDDEPNVCFLGYSTDCDRPYEVWMKSYLLRESASMPDMRDDPLVRTMSRYGMNLLDYEPLLVDRR